MVFLSLEVSSLCISGINYYKIKLSFYLMSLLVILMFWYLHFHRKKRVILFWGSFISSSWTVYGLFEILEIGFVASFDRFVKTYQSCCEFKWAICLYRINKFQGSSVSSITCVASLLTNLFLELESIWML